MSLPLRFWAGGPRPQTLATSLTSVEEAALLGSYSSLNDSPTASLHTLSPSCFLVLLNPKANLHISALPSGASIWTELNN